MVRALDGGASLRVALTSATSRYTSHSKVESLPKLDGALHLLSRKCRKLHNFAQLPPASRSRCAKQRPATTSISSDAMSSNKPRIGLTLLDHVSGCIVKAVSASAGPLANPQIKTDSPPSHSDSFSVVFIGTPLKPSDVIRSINGVPAYQYKDIFSQGDISAPTPPPLPPLSRYLNRCPPLSLTLSTQTLLLNYRSSRRLPARVLKPSSTSTWQLSRLLRPPQRRRKRPSAAPTAQAVTRPSNPPPNPPPRRSMQQSVVPPAQAANHPSNPHPNHTRTLPLCSKTCMPSLLQSTSHPSSPAKCQWFRCASQAAPLPPCWRTARFNHRARLTPCQPVGKSTKTL